MPLSTVKVAENVVDDDDELFHVNPAVAVNLERIVTFKEPPIAILDENDAPYILASDVDFDSHNAEYFEDMNHMSAKGRRAYTKELIRILGNRLK